MKLANLQVWVPLLEFEVVITHSIRRSATIFEKIIFDLQNRYKSNRRYDDLSLEVIFSEILRVPRSSNFLGSTLSELVDLGVLKFRSPELELHRIRISDLEVTSLGDAMIHSGQLPAVTRNATEKVIYDPIQREIVVGRQSYRSESGSRYIDAEALVGIDPIQALHAHFDSTAYPWLDDASYIDDLKVVSRSVKWLELTAKFVENSGSLVVEFEDERLTTYVNSIGSQRLLDDVIGMDFFRRMPWEVPVPAEDSAEFEAVSNMDDYPVPMGAALSSSQPHDKVFVRSPHMPNWYQEGSVRAGCLLIEFDQELPTNQFTIDWNHDATGCTVAYGGRYPFEDMDIVTANMSFTFESAEVSVGGNLAVLPVVSTDQNDRFGITIDSILVDLRASLSPAQDPLDRFLPILWMPQEEFWDDYVPQGLKLCEDIESLVEALDTLRRMADGVGIDQSDALFEVAANLALGNMLEGGLVDTSDVSGQLAVLSNEYTWINSVFR